MTVTCRICGRRPADDVLTRLCEQCADDPRTINEEDERDAGA